MPSKPKFTVERVCQALEETKGLIALAAKHLKCNHSTIYNYAKRYPKIAKCIQEQRELIVDYAELALFNRILAEEQWAVTLTLKTLGKNRGYGEDKESSININFELQLKQAREELSTVLTQTGERLRSASLNGHRD